MSLAPLRPHWALLALEVISDLDSSVTCEALYFADKKRTPILSYYDPENPPLSALNDKDYCSLLNLYSTPAQLESLVATVKSGNIESLHIPGPKGLEFFKAKYGVPDGQEVKKMADFRKWEQKAKSAPKSRPPSFLEAISKYQALAKTEFDVDLEDDYMARGLAIPQEVLEFTMFKRAHLTQLVAHDIPEKLWKPLYTKLLSQTFDSGQHFEFGFDDSAQQWAVLAAADMKAHSDIFLVDHAWTFTLADSKKQLLETPPLLERMEALMMISPEPDATPQARAEAVTAQIWRYANSYLIQSDEENEEHVKEQKELWYVMDELGTRIDHSSSQANFKCVPFIFLNQGVAFNVIWPIQDLAAGDEVLRDYTYGFKGNRSALRMAWGIDEEDEQLALDALHAHRQKLQANADERKRNPRVEASTPVPRFPAGRKLKVFTDMQLVQKNLTWTDRFEIVPNKDDADILYYAGDFQVKPTQMVNQFPNEKSLTFKNLLVDTVQSYWGSPEWLPESYNLDSQTLEFVGDYVDRQKSGANNHWIVKPWNFARGIGIRISDNLPEILRLGQAGPKIVSKYIERPILYEGRKFDLRYIILVRSVQPLEIYRFNMFWIRLANKQFSLDSFDDYEKHFTVMNYSTFRMQQLLYTDFIKSFCEQHPQANWAEIQRKLDVATRQVFEAAVAKKEGGFALDNRCAALYGTDVMIDADFNPKLLEVNFSPDCTRACNYDPNFFNDIFSVLYTDDWASHPIASKSVTKL